MTKRSLIFPALLLLALAPAWADGLSKRDAKRLKGEIANAAGKGHWETVGSLLEQLAAANDKKTFKFMLKVVEKAPPRYELHDVLRDALATMDDDGVAKEADKAATHSRSPLIRRALILHLANRERWDVLIDAMEDKDEQVAALATWKLVDNRIERAVAPMIDLMEKLEKDQAGIWDVLRNGLGKLLGGRSQMAIEYRSRWEIIKGNGGLSSVEPQQKREQAPAGELRSGVRLFGREIECTRVVFVLDVSGSMEAIDPNQKDYDDDGGSRTRGAGNTDGERPGAPKGKTRLERAQRQLKRVLKKLPATYQVNIVAYSSRVQIWRAEDGDAPPALHALSGNSRSDAEEFVDQFQANGVTATDDALRRAFGVDGVRCIYLLSDGFATHDGRNKIPTDEILSLVDSYKERHVTIHTLGFPQADREMMEAVARATGGEYTDIQ